MSDSAVHTLDLNFQGKPGTIASYMIPHRHGVVLVESGPGSTQDSLTRALAKHGCTPKDVTHVLITHIHLDHAGASGWLAAQGAHIYVHEVGAPHMIDPSKLIASATRIYGDNMAQLWGEFLPVPEAQLTALQDNDVIEIGELHFEAVDTPGHANHHLCYLLDSQEKPILFTGDIGGVRLQGYEFIRLPITAPEFHLEKWRESLWRLAAQPIHFIAPTHFGIFSDPGEHLARLSEELDNLEAWMTQVMPAQPDPNAMLKLTTQWSEERAIAAGLDKKGLAAYELANPADMAAAGIARYWNKFRQAAA